MATACTNFRVQCPLHSSLGSQNFHSSGSPHTAPLAPFFGVESPARTLQSRSVRHNLKVQARSKPQGFGPRPKTKKPKRVNEDDPFRVPPPAPQSQAELDQGYVSEGEDSVPEVVTNRMLSRMGLTVGVPLGVGLTFFPLFWYLKVIQHLDIPYWVPYLMSIFTFGAAAAGISYGILSVSWNPSQEGSLLGWKEAQANWPVFWELLKSGGKSDKGRR